MKFREKFFMAVVMFFSLVLGNVSFSYFLNLLKENNRHDFAFYLFAFVISGIITIFLFKFCYIAWKEFKDEEVWEEFDSENGEIQ